MNRTLVASLATTLIVGATIGFGVSRLTSHHDSDSVDPTTDLTANNSRKVLYWHDPMVPNAKFDKPGKSPFMDMQLVPVYADDEAGAAVRVNPSVTQNLGIRLGKVEKVTLQTRLNAVGSVAFDERLVDVVQARTGGYVTHLRVRTPLERVRRGQPLADILSPEWLSAQEEYLALLDAQSERGKAILEAARQRLEVLGVPEATIQALDKDRKTNATATLIAPSDGVISELSVREGAAFMAGAPLFRINGLQTVWVNAQVPEAQVSMIPSGSTVEVRATAWPNTTFKGQVVSVLPEVDLQTRALPVRIAVENPEFKLAPGMFVDLRFVAHDGEPQLAVPSEAVIMTGERNAVIVAREDGGFDVADVGVGADADDKTAITSGLQEGQSIVLSGQFLIDSEASLKSTVSRLSERAPMTSASSDPSAQPTMHLTQGTITAIASDGITISHDPVPSLKWPAMTMAFKPPTKGLSPGLKVGDRVSFSFSADDSGSYQIDGIALLDEPHAMEMKP